MPRTIVFTENAPVPPISYSQAVKAAGLIFVSGTAPINPVTGRLIMGTAATQTAQCLRNIAAILKAASFSLDKIVSATLVVVAEAEDFAAINDEWMRWFPANPPPAKAPNCPRTSPA